MFIEYLLLSSSCKLLAKLSSSCICFSSRSSASRSPLSYTTFDAGGGSETPVDGWLGVESAVVPEVVVFSLSDTKCKTARSTFPLNASSVTFARSFETPGTTAATAAISSSPNEAIPSQRSLPPGSENTQHRATLRDTLLPLFTPTPWKLTHSSTPPSALKSQTAKHPKISNKTFQISAGLETPPTPLAFPTCRSLHPSTSSLLHEYTDCSLATSIAGFSIHRYS
mmetsp:Transcript_44973/g.174643  ORF Transcript_44973/g.174643 Transcript_44973/m.174643 type:complete len:225 (-) Transcript_44973:44-718(-)